jgi:dihydroorotase
MQIELQSPFDAHLHLRDGAMLQSTVPTTAAQFAGAIVMPNLQPPLTDRDAIEAYRGRIKAIGGAGFAPAMTLFLTPEHTPEAIEAVRDAIAAVKLYPAGATTNSEKGLHSLLDNSGFLAVLEAMEAMDIPLCVHGETGDFVLDREAAFVPTYRALARRFPKLRIVMEHMGSQALLPLLEEQPNLFGTLTLHHMLLTLDHLAGGKLQPDLFCKPLIKTPTDRAALQKAALSNHPKIFFGSDSAPHLQAAKAQGAAGIFSAPVLLPALAAFFEAHDALEQMQSFCSDRARSFYRLDLPKRTITLKKSDWQVPKDIDGISPLFGGEHLSWRVIEGA